MDKYITKYKLERDFSKWDNEYHSITYKQKSDSRKIKMEILDKEYQKKYKADKEFTFYEETFVVNNEKFKFKANQNPNIICSPKYINFLLKNNLFEFFIETEFFQELKLENNSKNERNLEFDNHNVEFEKILMYPLNYISLNEKILKFAMFTDIIERDSDALKKIDLELIIETFILIANKNNIDVTSIATKLQDELVDNINVDEHKIRFNEKAFKDFEKMDLSDSLYNKMKQEVNEKNENLKLRVSKNERLIDSLIDLKNHIENLGLSSLDR